MSDTPIPEDLREHYEECGRFQSARLILCRQLIERIASVRKEAADAVAAAEQRTKDAWADMQREVDAIRLERNTLDDRVQRLEREQDVEQQAHEYVLKMCREKLGTLDVHGYLDGVEQILNKFDAIKAERDGLKADADRLAEALKAMVFVACGEDVATYEYAEQMVTIYANARTALALHAGKEAQSPNERNQDDLDK